MYNFLWILCISEFTVPLQEAYNEEIHLSPKDIATDNKASPQLLRATIKQSKFNPFLHRVTLFLKRTESPIHSVTGILPFLVVRNLLIIIYHYTIDVTNNTLSLTCIDTMIMLGWKGRLLQTNCLSVACNFNKSSIIPI